MKAVQKFKTLLVRKRPELFAGILGSATRMVQPPLSMSRFGRSKTDDTDDRHPVEAALTSEGVHRDIPISYDLKRLPEDQDHAEPSILPKWADRLNPWGTKSPPEQTLDPEPSGTGTPTLGHQNEPTLNTNKGHAHNPLEDTLILGINTSTSPTTTVETPLNPGEFSLVSESPSAVDINVYEKAYQEEIERLTREKLDVKLGNGKPSTLFLTRRVENNKEIRSNEHVTDYLGDKGGGAGKMASNLGFGRLVEQARRNVGDAGEDVGGGAEVQAEREKGDGGGET